MWQRCSGRILQSLVENKQTVTSFRIFFITIKALLKWPLGTTFLDFMTEDECEGLVCCDEDEGFRCRQSRPW